MLPRVDVLVESSTDFTHSVKASFNSIMESYKGIEAAMTVFKEQNLNGHYSVKNSVGAPMKQFELTMRELQQTLATMNSMLEEYENSPSDMLFKSETPNIGPGEKK